ncbi:MAG: FAD-dependent oxidoreductase, partial [Actinomycetales bacterium]
PQVHTSDTVMRVAELPRRIVSIGGGYVGAEFAHIFAGLGSEVTMVSRSSRLLKSHDADISRRFTEAAHKNWTVLDGFGVASIEAADSAGAGTVRVNLAASDGSGGSRRLEAGLVLLATGRTPNTDRLDVSAAGFDLADDGRLVADSFQRVLSGGRPVAGVWALGDISSAHQLKHVANHEARIVAHNLAHPQDLRRSDALPVPSAVFSRPQVASVGLTEEQARASGADVTTVLQEYGTTAYGWAMEDTEGFVKLIADRASGQLLGAHILGHQASLLIQPLVQAMSFSLPARSMAGGQYWIHPALTEVVENALLALDLP